MSGVIRTMEGRDLDAVLELWLTSNLQVHAFISGDYWTGHREMVRSALAEAEVYVYEEGGRLLGFLGLEETYVAGLFVAAQARSRGIGKALLDYGKGVKPQLSLSVYEKNTGAARFYRREGFRPRSAGVDSATGERELHMTWESRAGVRP